MSKVLSSKAMKAVRGGGGKMFGKSGSVAAKPFAIVSHGGMSKGAVKGGSGQMCGYSGVRPAKPL
jgi:hypothetical protein